MIKTQHSHHWSTSSSAPSYSSSFSSLSSYEHALSPIHNELSDTPYTSWNMNTFHMSLPLNDSFKPRKKYSNTDFKPTRHILADFTWSDRSLKWYQRVWKRFKKSRPKSEPVWYTQYKSPYQQ
ncbi:unnamed protein product [Rhizopus stolonifer]